MKSIVTVYRFDPAYDKAPYYQKFFPEVEQGESVLDVLIKIRRLDPSFCFSYDCRDRHCGLCGVMVNGKAVMACKQKAEESMKIEPLRGIRVIKDLVIDRDEVNARKESLHLYLSRKSPIHTIPEQVDPARYQLFKIACRCVECFCCTVSCPVWQRRRQDFAGPTAFVLEAQHVLDERDGIPRASILQNMGIEACVGCGLCSDVCIHKINPCLLIQTMRDRVSY